MGDYNADRIVNLGKGHGALDNGFGYTYFNEATGFEFSAVSGLTYNFTNPHTDYQNGIDWHTDLEASRFLYKQFFVGAVGYYFNQLTGDTGSGATLGPYQIAHRRDRAGGWGVVPYRGDARFLEPSGLLGICGSKPVVWLEYLVGFFNCADGESAEGRQINSG